jgi:hypothetical protein
MTMGVEHARKKTTSFIARHDPFHKHHSLCHDLGCGSFLSPPLGRSRTR